MVISNRKDDSSSDGDILMVSIEMSCEAWLLDLASSFHEHLRKNWFSSYIKKDKVYHAIRV